jgi:hypothetical protein
MSEDRGGREVSHNNTAEDRQEAPRSAESRAASDESRRNATARQELALEALLAGATVTDAASAAGVSRQTVHRWLAAPAFVAELRTRRDELRSALLGRLEALAVRAVERLGTLLDHEDPSVALRAAARILAVAWPGMPCHDEPARHEPGEAADDVDGSGSRLVRVARPAHGA